MAPHVLSGKAAGRPNEYDRPPPPIEDVRRRAAFLESIALEHNTRRGYRTGAKAYSSFCQRYGLGLEPTPDTLALFLAEETLHVKAATALEYLVGARRHLEILCPGWGSQLATSRASALVRAIAVGAAKDRAEPVRRKAPLRPPHLTAFLELALRSEAYDDLLMAAIASAGFYGCHRSGELVLAEPLTPHSAKKLIKRSSYLDDGSGVSYTLPYHKADRLFRGTVVLHLPQAVASPPAILRAYVGLRDRRHSSSPFLFLRENGQPPTRAWFEARLFRVVDRQTYGGHSLRAGGATFYASLGLSEAVIMALGRWTSSSWTIYIRDNPAVRAALELANRRP
jgi:hypothetical protein